MHHADAGSQRVKGRFKLHLLAVDQNIALIAAGLADHVHTEEDLHERALTGAVFAAEAQDLTCLQREVDIRQHLVAEEVLFDAAHLQKRSCTVLHICTLPEISGEELLPPLICLIVLSYFTVKYSSGTSTEVEPM